MVKGLYKVKWRHGVRFSLVELPTAPALVTPYSESRAFGVVGSPSAP